MCHPARRRCAERLTDTDDFHFRNPPTQSPACPTILPAFVRPRCGRGRHAGVSVPTELRSGIVRDAIRLPEWVAHLTWDKPRILQELRRLHKAGGDLSYNALARKQQALL